MTGEDPWLSFGGEMFRWFRLKCARRGIRRELCATCRASVFELCVSIFLGGLLQYIHQEGKVTFFFRHVSAMLAAAARYIHHAELVGSTTYISSWIEE